MEKPYVGHFNSIGSRTFVHIPNTLQKGKFKTRSRVGILVRYTTGDTYHILMNEAHAVGATKDVKFLEECEIKPKSKKNYIEFDIDNEESKLDDLQQPDDDTSNVEKSDGE